MTFSIFLRLAKRNGVVTTLNSAKKMYVWSGAIHLPIYVRSTYSISLLVFEFYQIKRLNHNRSSSFRHQKEAFSLLPETVILLRITLRNREKKACCAVCLPNVTIQAFFFISKLCPFSSYYFPISVIKMK